MTMNLREFSITTPENPVFPDLGNRFISILFIRIMRLRSSKIYESFNYAQAKKEKILKIFFIKIGN